MKKLVFALCLLLCFSSCENNDPLYEGEFILMNDAAVLKGADFIYGVSIDEMSKELASKVDPIKNEPYDMVPVKVKGVLKKKKEDEEGWEERLTITEIVEVGVTPAKADIKIEEKN